MAHSEVLLLRGYFLATFRLRRAFLAVGAAALIFLAGAGVVGLLRFIGQQRSHSRILDAIYQRVAQMESAARSQDQQIAQLRDLFAGMQKEDRCINIKKLPVRIEKAGSYCVAPNIAQELGRAEDAVTVVADNVDIDLLGGTINGHNTADTIGAGVYSAGYRNLTVRNGVISGFMYGIRYDPAAAPRRAGGTIILRNLVIRDSKFRGISIDFGPNHADGNVEISHSLIDRVGGTAAYTDAYAFGIEIRNTRGCRIFRNGIIDVYPVGYGEGVGISFTQDNGGCIAQENYLLNSRRPELGRTIGVWPGWNKPFFIFSNNVIFNYTYALIYTEGGTTFVNNVLNNIDCSPANGDVADYYARFDENFVALNKWLNKSPSCSDNIARYEKLAERGDPRAQYRLGRIYWEGISTTASNENAEYWFGLAAKNGSIPAQEALEALRCAKAKQRH